MHELHSDPLSPLILKSFFLYLLIISRLTHTSNGMDQLENSCIDQYVGSSNKEVGISTSYIGKDGRHQAMENINISDICWMQSDTDGDKISSSSRCQRHVLLFRKPNTAS